jgi:hypothetical protein
VTKAVIAAVSAAGEVCIYSSVDTHLVVDVNGWIAAGSGFSGVPPRRLFDTRPSDPDGVLPVTKQRYGGANILDVEVLGGGGIPTTGVAAVSLNVTAVDPSGPGFVTVFPCGIRPLTADVSYVEGEVEPNAVIAQVSPSGHVCLYSLVDTHLVVDVNGWFTSG